MRVTVWFPHMWPAHLHVARMLRENPDGVPVRVLGSHPDPAAAPALTACDDACPEPAAGAGEAAEEEYLDFALGLCRREGVDVVVPTDRLGMFAAHAGAFAGAGARVLCPPAEAVEAVRDKRAVYAAAQAAGVPLAPWRVADGAGALRAAVDQARGWGGAVCAKPAGEYSAPGFRILDDTPLRLEDVLTRAEPRVAAEDMAQLLLRAAREGRAAPELIVMPYLDPPEISVDCLADAEGELLSAVARGKRGRIRTLLDAPAATAVARTVVRHFRLAGLTNVQLRHWRGRPVLLEVNPRPSAGLHQTAHAGVNLPWAAVRLLLWGDAGPLPPPRLGGRLAVVEDAVVLSAP